MPTVQYNIERILERVPDQSPETILDVLNEIQTIVYSQNCIQTQKLDSTGLPPFLATTDLIYEYDCPADCRQTSAIFSLSRSTKRLNTRPVGPNKTYYFRNSGYALIAASSRDAYSGQVAKVSFQENPGTTTDVYYHLYYIQPTELSDVSVQLTIPEGMHWLLRKAVIAMFTTEEYGESAMDESTIERVAKKIRNSLNRGFQSNLGQTSIREEYLCDDAPRYGRR
ncbi:MAG: hypothetical protein IMZ58_08355 [Thermoplasmata archaeon]|nr:hypothetical protein [Thermoplasmata archaeon]